ncbi:hypothetical protein [Kribbella sp. CA-293567]|uniref:hypothetical protein n=1 Tax=Kribbella sp. CA-293567 TaxID=3002436 RepID=UPI0022DDAD6F|nr:hypothetical protein [Kribbella sp. CA-293567]WBQ03865.1 hypothetical protein OX958_28330 [Kribbella sp. CA-293567]
MGESVEINGHRIATIRPAGRPAGSGGESVCFSCGTHFSDRIDIENTPCADLTRAHEHQLVRAATDDLLYCRQCPMVAYDLADAATDPHCPLRLPD